MADRYECDQCDERFNAIKPLKKHQKRQHGNITYGGDKLADYFRIDQQSSSDEAVEDTEQGDAADKDTDNSSSDNSMADGGDDTMSKDSNPFQTDDAPKQDDQLFQAPPQTAQDDQDNTDTGSDQSEQQQNDEEVFKSGEDEGTDDLGGDINLEFDASFWSVPHTAVNTLIRQIAAKKYGKRPRKLNAEEREQLGTVTKQLVDELVPDDYMKGTGVAGAIMSMVSIHMGTFTETEPVNDQDTDQQAGGSRQDSDVTVDQDGGSITIQD